MGASLSFEIHNCVQVEEVSCYLSPATSYCSSDTKLLRVKQALTQAGVTIQAPLLIALKYFILRMLACKPAAALLQLLLLLILLPPVEQGATTKCVTSSLQLM
jgi:hypothetical protein